MTHYILIDKVPTRCNDLIKWTNWFETADRRVAKTDKDDISISTVFLGIDHSFGGNKPLLFETMVFGGEYDEYQQRYSTWEEAEQGHEQVCKLCGVISK